jgi:HK97 family phage major capsid protein
MNRRKKYEGLIAKAEARIAEIDKAIEPLEDAKQLKNLQVERNGLVSDIADYRQILVDLPADPVDPSADPGAVQRTTPQGQLNALGTYSMGGPAAGADPTPAQRTAAFAEMTYDQLREAPEFRSALLKRREGVALVETELRALEFASERRGKALKEMRSVTVGASNIVVPVYKADNIKPGFNEVSGLIDRVNVKPLIGGESFTQPYHAGYGTGDYKAEGADYADAEPTYGYATMNKAKITAYAEDSEEVAKLPAAAYDADVMAGVRIAVRKKGTREILVGTGAANRLTGIFSAAATAIEAAKDLTFTAIDETSLDEIVFSFGGDEDVEDAATLILNKADLKAFAQLRTADGKKLHTIVAKGNTGTIDGIPYIINSACKAISAAATVAGEYGMAYGPLSNYTLAIFSDLDVQRSTDYKFKQGMIAHKGVIFAGGNVTSKNGFLRVKKG